MKCIASLTCWRTTLRVKVWVGVRLTMTDMGFLSRRWTSPSRNEQEVSPHFGAERAQATGALGAGDSASWGGPCACLAIGGPISGRGSSLLRNAPLAARSTALGRFRRSFALAGGSRDSRSDPRAPESGSRVGAPDNAGRVPVSAVSSGWHAGQGARNGDYRAPHHPAAAVSVRCVPWPVFALRLGSPPAKRESPLSATTGCGCDWSVL